MSDEIFRPQRPQQQNMNIPPQFNPAHQFEPQNQPMPPQPELAGNLRPDLDNGVQITGNIPPQLLERLQKRKQKENETVVPSLNSFAANMSSNLLNVLESIKAQSSTYEEVTLPSKGRFYNGSDGPTNGKIHIRPMVGEEEQILATPRFVKKPVQNIQSNYDSLEFDLPNDFNCIDFCCYRKDGHVGVTLWK